MHSKDNNELPSMLYRTRRSGTSDIIVEDFFFADRQLSELTEDRVLEQGRSRLEIFRLHFIPVIAPRSNQDISDKTMVDVDQDDLCL